MPRAQDQKSEKGHQSDISPPPFKHVAILGTGLIGGSFGLALRHHWPQIKITGWDRPQVLHRALELGAITNAAENLEAALRDADLIYIALPVHITMEILPTVSRHATPKALVTDACGTKATICNLAAKLFTPSRTAPAALFLGGHPIAGKELSGIDHASKDLFEHTRYALVPLEAEDANAAQLNSPSPRIDAFRNLLQTIGAKPVLLDAETHDWATAIASHLPQLLSIALAGVVLDETEDETEDESENEAEKETDATAPSGLPLSLAGTGFRDMTRLAGSPYSVWRDICLTNSTNISRALDRLAQRIDYLRTNLTSKELESEFRSANRLYKTLRQMQ
jgi:prephenate dehydrogenase